MDINERNVRKYRFKTLFKTLDRSIKIINEFSEFLKLLDLREVGILRAMMVRFMIETTNADAGGLISVNDKNEYEFSEIFQYKGNRIMDRDFSPMVGKIHKDTLEYSMIETAIKREIPTLFSDETTRNSTLGKIVNISPSSIILVPVLVNDKVVYVVELLKKGRGRMCSFLDEDLQSLSIISNIASAIFTNAELFNSAIHDNLTGLYNIHYFKNLVFEEMVKVRKFRTKFSLAIIDLDHFKHINDTYGHSVGDEVLKFFSNILRQEIRRSSDIVARYGGDEFVVAFPSTDAASAYSLCSKIRDRLNLESFPLNEKSSITLTPSVGIAEILEEDIESSPTDMDLFRKVFVRADTALYNSKKTGRNKVTVYTKILPLIEEREL